MAKCMQNVTAPKDGGLGSITVNVGRGRSPMPPPSQTHKDRKKALKKNACRKKGRRRREDW